MAEKRTRFVGAHPHAIDDKGRTVLPAKIRNQLGETAILARLDDCVGLFNPEDWDDVAERLQLAVDEAETDAELRVAMRALRMFTSESVEVSPDQQGRIVIPATLREHADLNGELVSHGVVTRTEIWNRERFYAANQAMDETEEEEARYGVRKGLQRSPAERARASAP